MDVIQLMHSFEVDINFEGSLILMLTEKINCFVI